MSTRSSSPAVEDLRSQLEDIGTRFRALSDDNLFVLWFVRTYLIGGEKAAASALVGGASDRGVDAVHVDEDARQVFIVQGKYRQEAMKKAESRSDVIAFAELGPTLWGPKEDLDALLEGIDPLVAARLSTARERLKRRNYTLQLMYVTLGRISNDLRKEAEALVRRSEGATRFIAIDGRQVLALLRDYLDGVAPPVPSLDLPVESGGKIQSSGVIKRFDPESNIESWVFSMSGADVGELFKQAGVRVFARNVRGYLGSTQINEAMRDTIRRQPHHFWYFNNGVTIVCDGATKIEEKGAEIIRVSNPQIINGQQTTRVLNSQDKKAGRASVLVRVISIPRDADGSPSEFERLVSSVVEATNWQNAIRASDLMSNDRAQVHIERELRKLGYQYLRKRQTKGEARRAAGNQYRFMVKKEDLAQGVAACMFDPYIVRQGKERLFEERWYKSIFSETNADFYLNRYWLMRRVANGARGYPERGYAKWVVLHFLWGELGTKIERKSEAFRQACEAPNQHEQAIAQLDACVNRAFLAILQFYRKNRGTGPRALDVSNFFKRVDLHTDFVHFWRSAEGSGHRERFRRARDRFLKHL